MSHFQSFDLIILFFFLGAFASWVQSDLEIPEGTAKFLSIFLLLSLGLKGGHEVRDWEKLTGFVPAVSLALSFCTLIPVSLFYLLRHRIGAANASALAASYGSVSAVTFITTQSILESLDIQFSGFMVAVMALMEIPAIIIAIFLYKISIQSTTDKISSQRWFSILTTKSVVLLVGGFVIGILMNDVSWKSISPVVEGCFKGFLAFFLLDLGILGQKQLKQAWTLKMTILLIGITVPLFFGLSSLLLSKLFFNLSTGDMILLAVLVGSASYIAAPAAIKSAIPEANPSIYLTLPLALTFPMNLILGIPLYIYLSN